MSCPVAPSIVFLVPAARDLNLDHIPVVRVTILGSNSISRIYVKPLVDEADPLVTKKRTAPARKCC